MGEMILAQNAAAIPKFVKAASFLILILIISAKKTKLSALSTKSDPIFVTISSLLRAKVQEDKLPQI